MPNKCKHHRFASEIFVLGESFLAVSVSYKIDEGTETASRGPEVLLAPNWRAFKTTASLFDVASRYLLVGIGDEKNILSK